MFISCQKDELSRCIPGAWQAAAIPIIHFYGSESSERRPCATETVEERHLRGRWASIFLISIFHPVFPLSIPSLSLGPFNHKSLLGAITDAVLQWEGGRIDSRVEDEQREG